MAHVADTKHTVPFSAGKYEILELWLKITKQHLQQYCDNCPRRWAITSSKWNCSELQEKHRYSGSLLAQQVQNQKKIGVLKSDSHVSNKNVRKIFFLGKWKVFLDFEEWNVGRVLKTALYESEKILLLEKLLENFYSLSNLSGKFWDFNLKIAKMSQLHSSWSEEKIWKKKLEKI